jgi:hypothetical protein
LWEGEVWEEGRSGKSVGLVLSFGASSKL